MRNKIEDEIEETKIEEQYFGGKMRNTNSDEQIEEQIEEQQLRKPVREQN